MSGGTERPAIEELRDSLAGAAHFDIRPLDIEDARLRYAEEGFEFTDRLREFLGAYGEFTVSWNYRHGQTDLSTVVERTMDAPHATPRSARIYGKRIGEPVLVVGAAFSTEDVVLLGESGDVFLAGDAGIQRVAGGFDHAIRALVSGDWDKTFF